MKDKHIMPFTVQPDLLRRDYISTFTTKPPIRFSFQYP